MTLRDLRKKQGLTLVQLAKKVGLSFQVLSLYERKKRIPKIDTIKKLAEILQVSVEEIVECF